MKYLFLILLLTSCSPSPISITVDQVDKCEELGVLMKMKAHIARDGKCEITSELWGVSANFERLEDAMKVLDFQQTLKQKPAIRACEKKCILKIPNNLCNTEMRYRITECVSNCNSAEGLDRFIKNTKFITPMGAE